MVVLDTHVLVYDALAPNRLTARARRALAGNDGPLAASDISLWELAMLIAKGRLDPGADAIEFIQSVVDARGIQVLAVTPKIAVLAQADDFAHGDPADRIIAATAMANGAVLVSADRQLARVKGLRVLW